MANPLKIINDERLNKIYRMTRIDHYRAFENDLYKNFNILQQMKGAGTTKNDFIYFVDYYIINLYVTYVNEGTGNLPTEAMNDLKDQVLNAAKDVFYMFKEPAVIDRVNRDLEEMIFDPLIIFKTDEYLAPFR